MSTAPTPEQIQADIDFAVQTAREAGARLLGLRESGRWPDEKIMGDVGDQAADGYLQGYLRGRYPADGILSEETIDSPERLERARTWIVDPLDGSSDFGYSAHWSVHVALVVDGEPQAAAVAVPGWDTTWSTAPPPSRLPSAVESGRPPRIVVARSRSRFDGGRLQQALGAEVYAVGSAGVKAMAVVRGEVDAYVHGGGLYEWDSCAPVAVARAAGLMCCHLDGSELRFNKPDPWSPGLVIARPGLVDQIVDVMADRQP